MGNTCNSNSKIDYNDHGLKYKKQIWDVSDIIVMDKDEITEYKNYTNYAPLFVKRLFPDL